MEIEDDLRATVVAAIATSCYLHPAELQPDMALLDLGLDSLVITSIVATVENSVQRKFAPQELIDLFEIHSIGAFIDAVLAIARAPA